MDDYLIRIFFFLVIIPSAIFHEYMHGWVADRLGDPTARYAGRLTLNPLVHIDPWGTIIMPLVLLVISGGSFLFAYAKPVPYNPYNLRDQKYGPLLIAIAGPGSNFFLAAIFGILFQLLPVGTMTPFLLTIIAANIGLGVFNLVPIPPLDGSKVLFAFLPDSLYRLRATLEQYGFIILIVFILMFAQILSPIINVIFSLFTGGVTVF